MAGGQSKGSTTQTVVNDPWAPTVPYRTQALSDAQKLYEQGSPQLYPGSYTAQKSLPSVLAEELTLGRALGGSRLNDTARDQLQRTVEGGYLNSNPYLDATFNKAANAVQARTDSAFSRAGRTGSGAHKQVFQQGLNDLATDIYGNNYARERQYQNAGILTAPGFAQGDYGEIGKIAAVGAQRDMYNQQLLDEARQRFEYETGGDRNNLSEFINWINGAGGQGGTQSTNNPYYQNRGAGILGGALSGAQLMGGLQTAAPSLFQGAVGAMGPQIPGALSGLGGPWGLAAGAGLGILGGLF